MVVFHIDLNAFFASAEMIRNPSLKGKPVVVSGKGKKGVVCTASYEARNLGVRSAMPVFQAMKLCKDLVIVDGDYTWYEELSDRFIQLISSYSSKIERASIDECYVDMTEVILNYNKPFDLAIEIQTRLLQEIGLSCSIGIAPNKFLAKIASDMKKPLGITVLRKREVASKLWPLPIEAMGGIGKKTAPLLKERGIQFISDLCKEENRQIIESILGNVAHTYMNYAKGIDDSFINCDHQAISISQSTTLEYDISDYDSVKTVFSSLAKSVEYRMQEEGVSGSTITITIRYYDFQTITRSKKLSDDISKYEDIFAWAMMLFDMHDKQIPIRLLGIAISNLRKTNIIAMTSLFDLEAERLSTDAIIDQLNQEIGKPVLKKLSDLKR